MFPADVLSPRRRAALLAALAFALLATPVWAPTDDRADETHTYERSEVVVDDEGSIAYADSPSFVGVPISEELGCSTGWEIRICAFERLLVENTTVPTGMYTESSDHVRHPGTDPYRYVQIDGTVYETTYVANESAPGDDGGYRVDLALDPVSADEALERMSIDASSESDDVSPVVIEAARDGSATADREVEVPRTPIRLDDGRYYRVYRSEWSSSEGGVRPFDILLKVFGVTTGLIVLDVLRRRFEVSYVGDER